MLIEIILKLGKKHRKFQMRKVLYLFFLTSDLPQISFHLLTLVSLHPKYCQSLTATKLEIDDPVILLLEENKNPKQKTPWLYTSVHYKLENAWLQYLSQNCGLLLCKIISISKYYNLLLDTKFTSRQLQYICLYFRITVYQSRE